MPSSPGPNQYQRQTQRFFFTGVSLLPQDALPEGKVAFGRNIRAYQDGTITPRYGLDVTVAAGAAGAGPLHSLFRLNDSTPYAGADTAMRFYGSGASIYAGAPGDATPALVDTGYTSQRPLTGVIASPYQSPRPWLYLANESRQRKFDTSLTSAPIGLPQPNDPPTAVLTQPGISYLEPVTGGSWTDYGADAAGAAVVTAVSANVTGVLYDNTTTNTGMASIVVDDYSDLTQGATIDFVTAAETVIVHEMFPSVEDTTIQAITYDSGVNGLCTIQPQGSFGIGQTELPLPAEIRRRYEDAGLQPPLSTRVTVNRTVDYPVNAIVRLNGTEIVRIISVAVGTDGTMSFRCRTNGTFSVGQAIAGVASFRCYTVGTVLVGDTITADAVQNTITPGAMTARVAGIQTGILTSSFGVIGVVNRATQPDDIIRFRVKISDLTYVTSVRLYLNLSDDGGGAADFQHNYYFYEWRANDLLSAIQSGSTAPGTVAEAQAAAVDQGQVDTEYGLQYGTDPKPFQRFPGNPDATSSGTAPTGPDADDPATAAARAHGAPVDLTQVAGYTTFRATPRTDGFVSVGSTPSRQLGLGADQWLTLYCRISQLTRIGTRPDLTYNDINGAAIVIGVEGSTAPFTVQYSDCYLTGGFGPDTGYTLAPYVWCYRYRSTSTGARSNPSPILRGGLTPHRQKVTLGFTRCSETECDVIDFFRFGGTLARWTYAFTAPNDLTTSPPVVTFDDVFADRQIDGGETLRSDLYQPWPTYDLSRSGRCSVAGTAISHNSGDTFNTAWAPGSIIIINGRATTLYQSPASSTFLQVVDNCEADGDAEFQLPSPMFLAQTLPYLFGGTIAGVWFTFACGDPSDLGVLHWTNANDPDTTSDANVLSVCSASTPLLGGYVDDGVPYVFSTDQLYRLVPTPGEISAFRAVETDCTRGLWSPWALAVGDDAIYFLNKAGIFKTAGGSAAVSITDPDLSILFPQDGSAAEFVRGLYPIDFDEIANLKLTIVDGLLYFDYLDTQGEGHTLVYEPGIGRWIPDAYRETEADPPVPVAVTARISEPGPQVHAHLLGFTDGGIYQYTIGKTTDGDLPINYALWTPWANGGDPRADKQWGDAVLDFNAAGSQNGILVTPVVNNGNTALNPVVVGAAGTLRTTYDIPVAAVGEDGGYGVLSRNFGLWIEGAIELCDEQRPIFYLWEPSYLNKGTSITRRATDWEDLGYKGSKFVQGIVIRANTYGQAKQIEVQYDGPNLTPQVALTLSINHNGEQTIAYPLAAAGWTPFHAELVRLQGVDDVAWTLLDWRWVYEPAPEASTEWTTQPTTFDLPGFLSVFDGVFAYAASDPVTLTVTHDAASINYTLPSTAGVYARQHVIFQTAKGKSATFSATCDSPFRLYQRDCSVRVQGWGIPGGYQVVSPFGGPSRIAGAEI